LTLPEHPFVRLPVSHRSTAAAGAAGLLLSAVRAGDIDRRRRVPAPSSNGAAAQQKCGQ